MNSQLPNDELFDRCEKLRAGELHKLLSEQRPGARPHWPFCTAARIKLNAKPGKASNPSAPCLQRATTG